MKVIEATEVVEAVQVTETAEVLRSKKSLLRTSESSRFFDVLVENLCQRLLRPANVTFLKTG